MLRHPLVRAVLVLALLLALSVLASCGPSRTHAVCYVFGFNVKILCDPDRAGETEP